MVAIKRLLLIAGLVSFFCIMQAYGLEPQEKAAGGIRPGRAVSRGNVEKNEAVVEGAAKALQEEIIEKKQINEEARQIQAQRKKTLRPFVHMETSFPPASEPGAIKNPLPATPAVVVSEKAEAKMPLQILFFFIVIPGLVLFYFYLRTPKNPAKPKSRRE